jgi:hypothetical protein
LKDIPMGKVYSTAITRMPTMMDAADSRFIGLVWGAIDIRSILSPQFEQNFTSGGRFAPQLGQNLAISSLYFI